MANQAASTYTPSEMMTIASARLLRDQDIVFVGIGLPNLACNLAKRTHAPNMTMVYEAGIIGAEPERLPLSIGDPCLVSGAAAITSMYDIFALYLQTGRIDVGFLGGAQIDRFGNVNATVIGRYDQPKTRLPGSGGAAEIAAWAKRVYFITPHQPRRFPARCDFMTSAGFLSGRAERQQAGLRGGGPAAVVTDLGILEPDDTGELILVGLHPGVSVEQVQKNTGWPLRVAAELRQTEPPTAEELRLVRELDPDRVYLGRNA